MVWYQCCRPANLVLPLIQTCMLHELDSYFQPTSQYHLKNAYIIHHSNMKKDASTHKKFKQEIVYWLMSNASDTVITSSSRISKPRKVPEAKTTTNYKRNKGKSTLSAVQQLSEQISPLHYHDTKRTAYMDEYLPWHLGVLLSSIPGW